MKHEQQILFAVLSWFWVLPALPLGGWLLWKFWRHRAGKKLRQFVAARLLSTALPEVHWRERALQMAVTLLVLAFLAVALTRPLRGPLPEHSESKGVDFVVALDVSKSMWVEDVPPNRLGFAKKELGEFIGKLSGDRMGLIVFAGDAFVQAPVTYDYKALDYVMQKVGPKSISLGGTNIPRAVELAVNLLEKSNAGSKFLVIVSDGENLEGNAINAVRQARSQSGLTLFTVGVGTPTGGRVPAQDYSAKAAEPTDKPAKKTYLSSEYGLGVTSRLDSRELRQLAEAGGGRYYELKPGANTLQLLYKQSLLPLARKNQKIDVREYEEWFQIPLAVAIVLLLLQWAIPFMKKTSRSRYRGVSVVVPETLSQTGSPGSLARARKATAGKAAGIAAVLLLGACPGILNGAVWDHAEVLLKEGKKEDAVNYMRQEVQKNEMDPWLFYNYALTLYRAEQYEEAVKAFDALRQSEQGAELMEKISIQMGNAQVKLGEKLKNAKQMPGAILALERALGYYDESYVEKPSSQARNNREVASLHLEECLMAAGTGYKELADKRVADKASEEEALVKALQAFERVTELNTKNPDAPRLASEIRERLALNLAEQAAAISRKADEIEADSKKKPETTLAVRQQAVAKLDDALVHSPTNAAIQAQKKAEQDKMSDLLTKMAEKQMAKPLEKAQLDLGDQNALTQAKGKLDEALALNPDNQKARDLSKLASGILEKSHVDEGNKALANTEKPNSPQAQLGQGNLAVEQFSKALELNPENQDAQKGLAEANAKLPGLYAKAGEDEAAKANTAMKGKDEKSPSSKPKGGGEGSPSTQDMQKAVGFLEKANQDFGMALAMAPGDKDIQKRSDEIRDMLSETRDQLDKKNREGSEGGQPGKSGKEGGEMAQEGKNQEKGGESEGMNTTHALLSMMDLNGNAKPNTGDNFWQKKIRDW